MIRSRSCIAKILACFLALFYQPAFCSELTFPENSTANSKENRLFPMMTNSNEKIFFNIEEFNAIQSMVPSLKIRVPTSYSSNNLSDGSHSLANEKNDEEVNKSIFSEIHKTQKVLNRKLDQVGLNNVSIKGLWSPQNIESISVDDKIKSVRLIKNMSAMLSKCPTSALYDKKTDASWRKE